LPKLLGLIDDALGHPLLLMVDDDSDFCETMWEILHERGFRVSIAHSLQQARDQLRQLAYDVVIVDLKLPDGSGHEVFAMTREMNPHAQTIVVTGCRAEMDPVIQRIVQESGDVVFDKPLDMATLLDQLRHLS
jgi:DNA-binding response OmpR family regulator